MEDAYKYMEGFLPKPVKTTYIDTKDLDNNEVEVFPLDVLNVNGDVIGTAMNKTEMIAIWNADAANQAVGKITGWYGPFHVELQTVLDSGAPLKVTAFSAGLSNFFIDADNVPLVDSNDSSQFLAQ